MNKTNHTPTPSGARKSVKSKNPKPTPKRALRTKSRAQSTLTSSPIVSTQHSSISTISPYTPTTNPPTSSISAPSDSLFAHHTKSAFYPTKSKSKSKSRLSAKLKLNLDPVCLQKRFNATDGIKVGTESGQFDAAQHGMTQTDPSKVTPKLLQQNDPELQHRLNMKEQFWQREFKPSSLEAVLDVKTGLPKNPYADNAEFFQAGPKIDDTSNPYAISTKLDNEEYARQMTILDKFQENLGDLNGFQDPFLGKSVPKVTSPTTRGEMNAMLQHCILQQGDYEMAWTRFSQMINAIPDSMRGWIETSLFDQFNTPTIFKHDKDVLDHEPKVLFGPDQRTYQLMVVACLQAFEKIKVDFDPELVETCLNIIRHSKFSNTINDDECDSQATLMFRQLKDIQREIQRRKELPDAEQERLLALENGGLGILGQLSNHAVNDTDFNENNSLQNVGLNRAMLALKSDNIELTNKLEYHSSGITMNKYYAQQEEKLLFTGKTIVDIVDDPSKLEEKPIKYVPNRRIAADDSDTDGEFAVPKIPFIGTNSPVGSKTNTDAADDAKQSTESQLNPKTQYGQPILSARITNMGKRRYRISLPQLPFAIEDGNDLEMWLEQLEEQASITLSFSSELNALRESILEDPFSEPYHCYQQVQTWNARTNFIIREILSHYYAIMHDKNDRLYTLLCSNDSQPIPNLSGLQPINSSIGNSTEILDTAIAAAYDQELPYQWLEATTMKQKLTPAPIHLNTVSERKMMKKENFLKVMIFDEILRSTPTSSDEIDLLAGAQKSGSGETGGNEEDTIPKLSQAQFSRCLSLFSEYGQQLHSYIRAVKSYDASFLANFDVERKRLDFVTNHPRKLSVDEIKSLYGRLSPEELAEKNKIIDDIKREEYEKWVKSEKLKLHQQIQEAQGGYLEIETSYNKNTFHQTNFDELSEEQLQAYRAERPQPLQEMVVMDRLVAETVRRYPLLASLTPHESRYHASFDDIAKKRYGGKEKLPYMLRGLASLPSSPGPIDITQFSFDTVDKVNNFPYPASFVEELNNMDVSMVKVPVFNLILQPPADIQVNNDRANYQHLMLSPAASITSMKDAVDFLNKFTQMGRVVQKQSVELGEVEHVEEYAYQLDYQAFLQRRYDKAVKLTSIQNNSVNIRNMARLGMYYIDTMIISWAQQSERKLPAQFCEMVQQSYQSLTNDVFANELNEHTVSAMDPNSESNNTEESGTKPQTPRVKKPRTDSHSLEHDLRFVNPPKSRMMLWKQKNIYDQISNPTKFYSLSIDQRVELIDKTHEEEKAINTFAQFFAPDPNLNHDDALNKYHLLRAYIRFSMRSGDELSLRKALYVYRQSTRLLEYVQRRTNEDVYASHDKALEKVQSEADFERVSQELEQQRTRKKEMEENIPGSIRADLTLDDVEKATSNIGSQKKLWDSWYATDSQLKTPSGVEGDSANHSLQQSRETDDFVKESGMLDDYASRIDALLSGKHAKSVKKKHTTQRDGDGDGDGDDNEYIHQDDEKEIELYKNMVKKQKHSRLGNLYVPGFDQSDAEGNQDEEDENLVQRQYDPELELQNGKGSDNKVKQTSEGFTSSKVGAAGFSKGKGTTIEVDNPNNNNNDDDDDDEDVKTKHAPHTRLAKLATASHIKYDYLLTQMVINFHQFLIRNRSPLIRVGLPGDVNVRRFSDEVSSHWALARRNLYDQRIALIHSYDNKINPETGQEYTSAEFRERQKEKVKVAVGMLKKNRDEATLQPFERDAGQIAIMTLDTLIIEGYIPVAKIVAKQAYDDALLSKDFIETCFEQHGPDLEADESAIMSKELGLDQMMKGM